jgi:hypothetical protein
MLTYLADFHNTLFGWKKLLYSAEPLVGLPEHSFVDIEVAVEKLE